MQYQETVGLVGRALVLPHSYSHTGSCILSSSHDTGILKYRRNSLHSQLLHYWSVPDKYKNAIWKQLQMQADLGKQSSLSFPKEAEAGVTEVGCWHQCRAWSDLNFTEHFNAVINNFFMIDFFTERKKLCSTRIRSN